MFRLMKLGDISQTKICQMEFYKHTTLPPSYCSPLMPLFSVQATVMGVSHDGRLACVLRYKIHLLDLSILESHLEFTPLNSLPSIMYFKSDILPFIKPHIPRKSVFVTLKRMMLWWSLKSRDRQDSQWYNLGALYNEYIWMSTKGRGKCLKQTF